MGRRGPGQPPHVRGVVRGDALARSAPRAERHGAAAAPFGGSAGRGIGSKEGESGGGWVQWRGGLQNSDVMLGLQEVFGSPSMHVSQLGVGVCRCYASLV